MSTATTTTATSDTSIATGLVLVLVFLAMLYYVAKTIRSFTREGFGEPFFVGVIHRFNERFLR